MATRFEITSLAKLAAIAAIGFVLAGCQGVREATGVAKLAPDEFTVLTKAPLIIPPDYNLRPPQPGAPDRNLSVPSDQARGALFQQNASNAANALSGDYSESERLLLARTGGSIADPIVRRQIGVDSGRTDQGEDFARGVLYPEGGAPAEGTAPVRGTQ
jgi:hypothetical protein